MKQLTTKDLSTFLEKNINQTYHPVSSPLQHANFYAHNCKSPILDIGFGLGYVAAAAINFLLGKNQAIDIICLEKNRQIIKKISGISVQELEPGYTIIKKLSKNFFYRDKNMKIKLIPDDARIAIKKINRKFSTIFLDGFSPMQNPELYSVEFLSLMKEKLKKDGVILCHSQNPVFRAGLKELNFSIGNLDNGTMAGLNHDFKLDEKDEKLIRAFRPFHDPKLNWSRERILKEWGKFPPSVQMRYHS